MLKFSWARHSASASAPLFANRSTSCVVVIIYFFSTSSIELYGASGKLRTIDSSQKYLIGVLTIAVNGALGASAGVRC